MFEHLQINERAMIKRNKINNLLSSKPAEQFVSFVAGAGYGKSMAVSSFLADTNMEVIWLSLTPLDNYISHLWENIISSVEMAEPELAQALETMGFPQDLAAMYKLRELLAETLDARKNYVLVLDDYHILTEDRIRIFFQDLVFLKIKGLRMYVLSREKNEFLEQREDVLKITEQDLAFSINEIQEYLALMGIEVSNETLLDIYNKTNGWPFAMLLAAITMQNNPVVAGNTFSFSEALVFDTIEKEWFSKLSSDEQTFLLELSLLEFYPQKLVQDVFQKISPRNLQSLSQYTFMRYNRHTNSYQFHQLFRDFLNSKIYLLEARRKKDILTICGEWFLQHGMMLDALNCYRKIADYDRMWRLISNLFPSYFSMDFAAMLLEIMDEFPDEFIKTHPEVLQTNAMLQVMLGNAAQSVEICQENIKMLKASPQTPEIKAAIGENYVTMAFSYMFLGDTAFQRCFETAAEYLDGVSMIYSKPCMLLLNGDPITLKNSEAGAMEAWVTAIEQSTPQFEELVHTNLAGIAPLVRATACYYRNDLKTAEEFAQKALYQSLDKRQIDIICQSYFLLMRLDVARGDYRAVTEHRKAIESYRKEDQLSLFSIVSIALGWFYGAMEQHQYIPEWIVAETIYASDAYVQAHGFERIVKAFFLLNEGRYTELVAWLLLTQEIYQKFNKHIYLIHTNVMLAIAYYKTDQMDAAIRAFYTAYDLSFQNGIIQPFIELGKHLRSLLSAIERIRQTDSLSDETKTLLLHINDEWLENLKRKAGTWRKMKGLVKRHYIADHPHLEEARIKLSKNEQEVLQYIGNGFKREEIADCMALSTSTVKNIINTLYGKLGAQNSAHAVCIAMQKGLIQEGRV